MVAPILIPILAKLAEQGLDLIGSAVLAKGRDVVEKELGVNLETANTPELQMAQITHEERLLEMALEEKKLDAEYYKVDAADRDSARTREAAILVSEHTDWFNKSIASVLALLVIFGGGLFLYYSSESDIKYGVISLMTAVLTYYFGSSKTSAQKDTAINNLSRR